MLYFVNTTYRLYFNYIKMNLIYKHDFYKDNKKYLKSYISL